MTSPEVPSEVPVASTEITQPTSKKGLFTPRTVIPVALVLLILVFFLARSHQSFDWRSLGHQLRSVSPKLILIAFACTYFGYWLRAWRWAVLLGPLYKTTTLKMLPSQLIGFTIVALFGRFADLGRPYLIARRLKTPVATQLAVYSIERAFDLAAAAIIFSATLAFAPRNMPHHEAFARAAFALSLRFAGNQVARIAATLLRPISATFAQSASDRVLEFSQGLRIVSTLSEFLSALAISVGMWLVIAIMYLEGVHSFRATPSLANLSFAATMLLLATGLGGSLIQLPILGWFTQIAVLAAALHGFFDVPLETATACGAVLLVVATLAVIPGGLIAAQIEGISLREAATNPVS
jgi:uncharacterized membrane protein YbhN (UPF0104 family)